MLTDYVKLGEGDWVMQNGANSAVCIFPLCFHVSLDLYSGRSDKRSFRLQLPEGSIHLISCGIGGSPYLSILECS